MCLELGWFVNLCLCVRILSPETHKTPKTNPPPFNPVDAMHHHNPYTKNSKNKTAGMQELIGLSHPPQTDPIYPKRNAPNDPIHNKTHHI